MLLLRMGNTQLCKFKRFKPVLKENVLQMVHSVFFNVFNVLMFLTIVFNLIYLVNPFQPKEGNHTGCATSLFSKMEIQTSTRKFNR
jgi:hypothetical protein